jgi:hypothetical protein
VSIDTTAVGQLAARLMEDVEREYSNATLLDATLIVEVGFERDGEPLTAAEYRCTSDRAAVALGHVDLTRAAIKAGGA